MANQNLWTKEQLLLAINLYTKLPFGKLDQRTKEVVALANLIGRTPAAVAYKLNNFASLDPELQDRGIKGLGNTSKLDKEVWNEFYNNWDDMLLLSEELLTKLQQQGNIVVIPDQYIDEEEVKGLDVLRQTKARMNQNLFRRMILASYNNTCCFTGLQETSLLVASHIVPWSVSERNRLNPVNGLCLNALHDKAFDRYLITVDAKSLRIKVSSKLLKHNIRNAFIDSSFNEIEGKEILLPDKFFPSGENLKFHNDHFIL